MSQWPQANALLLQQVVQPLRAGPGKTLVAVHYGLFPYEAESFRLSELGPLSLDAEVRLCFSDGTKLFVSWTQTAGWSETNSLAVAVSSFHCAGSLVYEDASLLSNWTSCLGARLVAADVLGWLETPAFLRLKFEHASILIGVGYESGFGNADRVIVRPHEDMWLDEAVVLWSSHAGGA
ncbi:hypothetical protein [Hydrogenophaga luteola]|uniref:Uncharacterized protein n=1 Tax=Hydrogenophaga luteola TaxID=1591122 RepID=A0ABV7WC11_9BURK